MTLVQNFGRRFQAFIDLLMFNAWESCSLLCRVERGGQMFSLMPRPTASGGCNDSLEICRWLYTESIMLERSLYIYVHSPTRSNLAQDQHLFSLPVMRGLRFSASFRFVTFPVGQLFDFSVYIDHFCCSWSFLSPFVRRHLNNCLGRVKSDQ